VLLSSENALEHFADLFPEHLDKARLSPFPSLFAFEAPAGDPLVTIRKFNLPTKFALVANQFWRHKNHEVVIEAIRQLHCKGISVPLVMTGLAIDYRDRNNETTSRILQAIASAGLSRDITVLGMVDDSDLANLMRAAAVVIQPSLFEGWSLGVQDCKALGRPLICSDIAVHREQAPDALGFFRCDCPDELADLLAQNWSAFDGGPDPEKEKRALAAEQEFAQNYGQRLLEVCKEAMFR
jgi:glycosyltransferase involved in cell wall biosynthesis